MARLPRGYYGEERRYNKVCPDGILRLAERCPAVHSMVGAWRGGACSWEEALMLMVQALADENERLLRDAQEIVLRSPLPIFTDGPQAALPPEKGKGA